MFRRFFGPTHEPAADRAEQALRDGAHGETATVRRIVARLEAMPPDHARLAAAAAYTLARAANADLHISEDETHLMEHILQEHGLLDEAESVVVVEMAKLQAKAVGGASSVMDATNELVPLAPFDWTNVGVPDRSG